jgi:TrmH family RNA methyltransferase
MISKNQVKLIKSLHVKKFREREGLFIAEGEKIVKELLSSSFKIHSIYFTDEWNGLTEDRRNERNHFKITDDELKKISLLETQNQVLAIVHIPENKIDLKKITAGFTLILDDIRDPGNLGTIIRIADWYGMRNIICSDQSVDAFNPKVVQSSMGSIFRTNIFYEDLGIFLKKVKKEFSSPIYGAVLDGQNVLEKKLNPESFLLMGNESKGISPNLLKLIDEKITIPKPANGSAESLNVSIATSILCHEFFKQYAK